jgi:hypothetical protein
MPRSKASWAMAKHFYRNIRWDFGQLGHVGIVFPDPMPMAELEELENVAALWLKALRRRSEAAVNHAEEENSP